MAEGVERFLGKLRGLRDTAHFCSHGMQVHKYMHVPACVLVSSTIGIRAESQGRNRGLRTRLVTPNAAKVPGSFTLDEP